jgi:FkbM family methyltransferase
MYRDMISFAQNAEDVVLWRLFESSPRPGFYVDVGAAHPVYHSVTKWFSLVDWRGVNIEPVPYLFDLLASDRPDDVNLQVACGAAPGIARIAIAAPEKWGQSSIDTAIGARLDAVGLISERVDIQVVTLASVLDAHSPEAGVDFLKIDVEGAEREVLAGAEIQRHLPRVIVVEAVEPDSTVTNYDQWEGNLLDAGYLCVLFDGLNRFYCRSGDQEARDKLGLPAYCLDRFVTHREQVLRATIERVDELLGESRELLSHVRQESEDLLARLRS